MPFFHFLFPKRLTFKFIFPKKFKYISVVQRRLWFAWSFNYVHQHFLYDFTLKIVFFVFALPFVCPFFFLSPQPFLCFWSVVLIFPLIFLCPYLRPFICFSSALSSTLSSVLYLPRYYLSSFSLPDHSLVPVFIKFFNLFVLDPSYLCR